MEYLLKSANLKAYNYVTNGLLLILISFLGWNLLRSFISWIQIIKKRPPGPFGLPFVGYLPFLGEESHKTLWNMKERYGDIIGLYMGPSYTVILNEYNVMKEVLCNTAALDRSPHIFEHIPRIGFITENGRSWIEQRRFCMTAIRDLGFGRGQWEDIITEEAIHFCQKLENLKGESTDITHLLASSLVSNVIGLLIGRKLDEEKEADKIQLALEYSSVALSYTSPTKGTTLVPGLRKLFEILKISGYDKTRRIIEDFSSFLCEEIHRHKSSPTTQDTHDFMGIYLDKLNTFSPTDVHAFSESMLEGNVNLLFLGSNETILSSLVWLLRLMVKHKDIQAKVSKELMEVVGKEGRARFEERHKIPFTFATVLEAQRFSSIVPMNTTRRVIEDIEIGGCTIPKGAEVTVNLWGLHNDPAYWERPEEFRPERFLTDDETKIIKQPPSYVPFSLGRRNCPGETIAWMEILPYFTEIVKRFEICTAGGTEAEFKIIHSLVSRLEPQELCFVERNDYR